MGLVRLGLSPRASGLSRPEAQAHWRGVHARLFAGVPGVCSYVQNHTVLGEGATPLLGDPGFDIFSEVEFADEQRMTEAMASNWYREEVIPDERRLLDASRRCFLVTQRSVDAGAEPPEDSAGADCKLVVFLEGAGRDETTRKRDTRLAPLVDGAAAVVSYRVLATGGAAPRRVDAVLAGWFASPRAAMQAHCELSALIRRSPGLRVDAAVIVRENEVVPRKRGAVHP